MTYNPDQMPAHIVTGDLFQYYHYRNEQSYAADGKEDNFYKMCFFLAGNASCRIEGRTYRLQPDDILLISSGDAHHTAVSNGASSYECITLSVNDDFFSHLKPISKDLTACFKDALQRNCRLFHPDEASIKKLRRACTSIEQELEGNAFGRHVLAYSSVIEILVLLNRAYFETLDTADEDVTESMLINQILIYINEHLSEPLTLETIAAQFFISKNHLSHQFKHFTGLSPYQYIMKKRLKTAYNMLCNGTTASSACEKCGFNDYSNFLKAFRREFGKNPSDLSKYRKINRQLSK